MIKNVQWSSLKHTLFCEILMNLDLFDRFSKNTQISKFMKTRPLGTEFFHAEGQKDRHDEVDSRFLQFSERA
jgi:hypothetical protein